MNGKQNKKEQEKTNHPQCGAEFSGTASDLCRILCLNCRYSKTFYPHTIINNIDYSGMTPEETENSLIGANGEYTLTLKFRNDKTETISGADFQYSYLLDSPVSDFLLDQQNPLMWIFEQGKSHEYTITGSPVYNEEKFRTAASLPELQTANMEAPVDAALTYENNQ